MHNCRQILHITALSSYYMTEGNARGATRMPSSSALLCAEFSRRLLRELK